jgi:acyl-CoA synthetase (AMP-forming)/AMP-acid ligase II
LEVDAALLSVTGVGEAVAFGVADTKYGEKVWAAVVLKSGAKVTEAEIIKGVKAKISAVRSFLSSVLSRTCGLTWVCG